MRLPMDEIRELEHRAARTWPAQEAVSRNGWLLRASGGTTKRANSVLTAGDAPADEHWLEEIESFYRERMLPPTFHITDGSPAHLDELLERHGYVKEFPCLFMIGQSSDAIEVSYEAGFRHDDISLRVTARADDRWLDDFIRLEGFPEQRRPFYFGLFSRMLENTSFFALERQNETVAVATTVREDGWSGIINVAVDERHRGQGIGKLLMRHVAQHSLEQEASRLYLQVVADNEPAVRMYRRLGFTPAYGYHYRSKPTPYRGNGR